MSTKNKRSFRLTPIADDLLDQLADRKGLNKTAVLETLIREAAKSENITTRVTTTTHQEPAAHA